MTTTRLDLIINHEITLDMDILNKIDTVYRNMKLMTHPEWSNILDLLYHAGTMKAGDIHKSLRLEQTWCSQGLRKLRKANLVKAERRGKEVFYTLNKDKVDAYIRAARKLSSL